MTFEVCLVLRVFAEYREEKKSFLAAKKVECPVKIKLFEYHSLLFAATTNKPNM